MKLNFFNTFFTLVAFSSFVSPIFIHSSKAMDMEDKSLIVQIAFPINKCTRIMKKDSYGTDREVNDWEMLKSCRLVSTAWKAETDDFIIKNNLLTLCLKPDNYKDERIEGLAPLVTVIFFKGWKGDNLEKIGSALVASTFPSLKTLEYWGHDQDVYSDFSDCHSLGKLGSKSLADMLIQGKLASLQELKIVSSCDPILWKSLDKLPNLKKLHFSSAGDLYKFAKKVKSLKNLTSLTWDGWLDRLNVRKLYKELKKGNLENLEYLKISSYMQISELEYAAKKFSKLQDKRPNLKVDTSR